MRKRAAAVPVLMLIAVQAANAASEWTEGTHYFRILPAQRTMVPEGKVEVAEAFSYGCPACNSVLPVIEKLEASLPPVAQLTYVPASFNPREQWPLFQRAYHTAKLLKIDKRTHLAMFDAVWGSGELAVVDRQTRRLINPPPDITDVARFYARVTDVTEAEFLSTAKSFSVTLNMDRADQWIKDCHVDRTPSFVVNGKYRVHFASAGGTADKLIELVNWLVARESGAAAAASKVSD
ncbi:MAG: thiol:disulfide interchange protein DsbA/DsbL [Gammaproteobacteria bacterium]